MSSYIVSPLVDEDIFEVWRYLYERAGVEIVVKVAAPEKRGQAANFRAADRPVLKRLRERKFEASPCFSG